MPGAKFFKLYNQLLAEATAVDDLIVGLVNHIEDTTDNMCACFGAVTKKGCLTPVISRGSAFNPPDTLPMTVTDVHRHLFGLSNYYVGSVQHIEGMPFLSHPQLESLRNHMCCDHKCRGSLITLNFFIDGFLNGVILLTYPDTDPVLEHQLNEILFLRDSIEALMYKVQRNREETQVNHLFSTGETIIRSSHYQHMDSRDFMTRLLNLAYELSDEADFGSALLFENGYWAYIHSIGHDFSKLKDLHLPGEIYMDRLNAWKGRRQVAPNVFIVPLILDTELTPAYGKSKAIIDRIITASLPIKETLQLHIYFNGVLKAVLSLDIKAGSHNAFTNKSINILRRMDFLGQIHFTNASMNMKGSSFEKLTDLISGLAGDYANDRTEFLEQYLKLIVESLYEASYATAYIRDSKGIHFLASVGHDLKALQDLNLKPEHFISVEKINQHQIPFVDSTGKAKTVSATLFSDLLRHAEDMMEEDVYNRYIKATKPVKDAIISQARLTEDAYMYISCDIAGGSQLNFSNDSMQLFSALNNLAFSFISNEYYMNEYRTLNTQLENKILERTKELEISNRKLQAIADKDGMTGLLNHKTIIHQLDALTNNNKTLSICLFDIDHFKQVNDTYGHQVGDDVLIRISQLLKDDQTITSGRYGGEEFLIILDGFSHDDAVAYCTALLKQIKTTDFGIGQAITVSGGVVARKDGNASELIQTADTLLYEAKNSGRDRLLSGYR